MCTQMLNIPDKKRWSSHVIVTVRNGSWEDMKMMSSPERTNVGNPCFPGAAGEIRVQNEAPYRYAPSAAAMLRRWECLDGV